MPLSRRFPFLALYQVLFFKSLKSDGSPSTLNASPIKGYRLLVSGSPKVENSNISKILKIDFETLKILKISNFQKFQSFKIFKFSKF